jgi:hypothetical protein
LLFHGYSLLLKNLDSRQEMHFQLYCEPGSHTKRLVFLGGLGVLGVWAAQENILG